MFNDQPKVLIVIQCSKLICVIAAASPANVAAPRWPGAYTAHVSARSDCRVAHLIRVRRHAFDSAFFH